MKFPQLPGRKSRKDKLLDQLREQAAAARLADEDVPEATQGPEATPGEHAEPEVTREPHAEPEIAPEQTPEPEVGTEPTPEPEVGTEPTPEPEVGTEPTPGTWADATAPLSAVTPGQVPGPTGGTWADEPAPTSPQEVTQRDVVEGWDEEPPARTQESEPATPPPVRKKKGLLGKVRSSDSHPRVTKPRRSVISLDGFRDPVRRPRYLLWTFAGILGIAAVMILALGVTSTKWFCSEGCHKVQDDTIQAYNNSSHRNISCMACHMPVNSNPVVFIMHKAEALGELYLTVTNQYELPLNGASHVALEMESKQCTQCHDPGKRKITPSAGIIIDHKAHAEAGVECAVCHNRVAHRENFELALNDPNTGEQNRKHTDFMTMTACFRCHTQGEAVGPVKAPGECIACHPEDFELKPKSHLEPGFFPENHGKLGAAEASRVAQAKARSDEGGEAGEHGESSEGTGSGESELHGSELGLALPNAGTMNYCNTCHAESFCVDCHGVPMPHPADFKEGHGTFGKKNPAKCVTCHGAADKFCDQCHHGTALKWKVDTRRTWVAQHFEAVDKYGASTCFKCHEPTYCARCHVRGTPNP